MGIPYNAISASYQINATRGARFCFPSRNNKLYVHVIKVFLDYLFFNANFSCCDVVSGPINPFTVCKLVRWTVFSASFLIPN